MREGKSSWQLKLSPRKYESVWIHEDKTYSFLRELFSERKAIVWFFPYLRNYCELGLNVPWARGILEAALGLQWAQPVCSYQMQEWGQLPSEAPVGSSLVIHLHTSMPAAQKACFFLAQLCEGRQVEGSCWKSICSAQWLPWPATRAIFLLCWAVGPPIRRLLPSGTVRAVIE